MKKMSSLLVTLLILTLVLIPITGANTIEKNTFSAVSKKQLAISPKCGPELIFQFNDTCIDIINVGNETAYDISWKASVTGLILIVIGSGPYTGVIPTLTPNETWTFCYPHILGIGPVVLRFEIINATDSDNDPITTPRPVELEGFVIGPFLLGFGFD